MPKTPEQPCPYDCGRIIPEGAGRTTCGKQPCRGMAASASLKRRHELKILLGREPTIVDILDLSSEEEMQPTGSCKIYYGSTSGPQGYGYFVLGGERFAVHRAALEFYLGRPLKLGMESLHTKECNRPRCINRECLYEGTASERALAAVERGTHARKNYHITPEVAEEIRQLVYVDQLDNDVVGEKYLIDGGQVSRIAWRLIYSDRPLNDWERERLEARKAKKRRDNQKGRRVCSDEEAREIKRRLASGESGVSIARDLNRSQVTISEIKTGKTYRDVN